ncbi:unnamed protein product (macronuclear) [Paramecium tetraurelia]|uniref:VPS9 domain-containing protein n=1 Tax=Paramecium tetraurelia TaxID=5888 RepID=A0BF39_PARTE|nr:uncharacterized protein GSPATT00028191001 [Paramecium tetraurelia]CAK57156.1 unnamed protein product [Paramecium tetraurelia]|eukprot:XP_001424554.1 hypothetical protein (macronuclear) [Paramecium tetraurelia strain d4-2]
MSNMISYYNQVWCFCKFISIYYVVYRKTNEYLRQDLQSTTGTSDLTISTNSNSIGKINESQSISSKILESMYPENQNSQVSQFYVFLSCINDALSYQKHPFIHIINFFREWAINQLISMKDPQNTTHQLKLKLQKFQSSSDLFLNFLVFSLNEYLGDFGDDISDEGIFKYIKDKQNYFNLFLEHTFDDTLIIHLMEVLNYLHKNNNNNFIEKIKHIRKKPDFFEIPKKYQTQETPFLQEISCLNEVQYLKRPAAIFCCFTKTYLMIKDHLTRSASNFLFFQVTNYVIVHSNIENFHALLHLLELFYCNSPILLKYNQSLEFIQNIIIS